LCQINLLERAFKQLLALAGLTQNDYREVLFKRYRNEGDTGTWENFHQIRKLRMNSKPPFKLDLRDVFRITIGRQHAINVVPAKTSASPTKKRGIVPRVTGKDDQVYSVASKDALKACLQHRECRAIRVSSA
jgi:hypothetical protein